MEGRPVEGDVKTMYNTPVHRISKIPTSWLVSARKHCPPWQWRVWFYFIRNHFQKCRKKIFATIQSPARSSPNLFAFELSNVFPSLELIIGRSIHLAPTPTRILMVEWLEEFRSTAGVGARDMPRGQIAPRGIMSHRASSRSRSALGWTDILNDDDEIFICYEFLLIHLIFDHCSDIIISAITWY